jgi:hypothetical protein
LIKEEKSNNGKIPSSPQQEIPDENRNRTQNEEPS